MSCVCKYPGTFYHVGTIVKFIRATGADPGFDRGGGGGPDRDRPKLLTMRSSIVRAK